MKTPIRSKSVGFRVTEQDYELLQGLADREGKPLGEWCRDVLLDRAKQQSTSALDQIILEELLALRVIVSSVIFATANGGKVQPEQMKTLIAEAEKAKFGRAKEVLEQAIERYGS